MSDSSSCGPTYNGTVAVNDIDSISFNNIVNLAVVNLASIGITNVKDLLTIDEDIDGFDVICTILKQSIDKFEYTCPFGIDIYPYYTMGQVYKFQDNFFDFIAGKVDRKSLQLVPRVIISIVGEFLGTLRCIEYEPPYMTNIIYTGCYKTHIVANRPYQMIRVGNKFTDDSKYYYMGENHKEFLLQFRTLFEMNLCDYIVRLNENLEHPNVPINTFNGLNNYASNLRSQWEEMITNSFTYYGIYDNE